MPITLSTGVVLTETGSVDDRGFQLLTDEQGSIYTNQNGRIILSSGPGMTGDPLTDITRGRLEATVPPQQALEIPGFKEFRGAAEAEISPFFDKSLAFLTKQIDAMIEQARVNKETGLERVGEDRESFRGIEDRAFANALRSAQFGFSGRGTFTSGFRRGEIHKQIVARRVTQDLAARGFTRTEEDLTTDFAQFLERQELKREGSTLDLLNQKEAAIKRESAVLRQEEIIRRRSTQDVFSQAAAAALA